MTIREQLGITQEEASEILGVTRGQLSMYELGKRDLPTHALVKLATLSNHVSDAMNKQKHVDVDQKTVHRESGTIIDELLAKHQLKKIQLERNLKKMKATEQKAFAALQVAMYEQTHNKKANKNTVEHIQWQAEKKLANNNWQKQLACQFEIVALEGMIAALKAHKDKL
ncbi:helix-turn-helix transcriptional regulator [Flavobacterium sp. H122]|uniref:helix-turn-helix domain-containing protein n=1 Tax=Flavobacterium sp. H122 TaxID=2529860 RepID=UPI0010AAC7F0|nr:helix-turn-helix transcriptional regulator [Flavobacterium sp. H122]